MLKSVRIVYRKKGDLKFISHLDVNRLMLRLVNRAGLPIWHTEGFHPHPYITFAVPLSLGFESEYDLMDIRVTDDAFDVKSAAKILSKIAPNGIEFVSSDEPKAKYCDIHSAVFDVRFYDADKSFADKLSEFLGRESIVVPKKRKNGKIEDIEISHKILKWSVVLENDDTILTLRLPAGSAENLNPQLIISAFMREYPEFEKKCMSVSRGYIFDKNGEIFI